MIVFAGIRNNNCYKSNNIASEWKTFERKKPRICQKASQHGRGAVNRDRWQLIFVGDCATTSRHSTTYLIEKNLNKNPTCRKERNRTKEIGGEVKVRYTMPHKLKGMGYGVLIFLIPSVIMLLKYTYFYFRICLWTLSIQSFDQYQRAHYVLLFFIPFTQSSLIPNHRFVLVRWRKLIECFLRWVSTFFHRLLAYCLPQSVYRWELIIVTFHIDASWINVSYRV